MSKPSSPYAELTGETVGERVADAAFALGWQAAKRLPERSLDRAFRAGADLVWRRRGSGVKQLEANLARVRPGLSPEALRQLARDGLRSYFRYWHEVFALPTWTPQRVLSTVEPVNLDRLEQAFRGGRGVILALPHMANWDLAGAYVALSGMPVTSVAERLRPDSLFDRFVAYRRSIGVEVVSLTPDARPVHRLLAALGEGRLVCLVADRDLTGAGLDVELLGQRARLPAGPATLARRSGAALFAVALSYRGPVMRGVVSEQVEPALGVRGMTQRLADHFSDAIRDAPGDWHMMQPVFAADRVSAESRPVPST